MTDQPAARERAEQIHQRLDEIQTILGGDHRPVQSKVIELFDECEDLRKELEELRPQIDAEMEESMVIEQVNEMLGKLPLMGKAIRLARPELVAFLKTVISEVVAGSKELKNEMEEMASMRAERAATVYATLIAKGVPHEQAGQITCSMINVSAIPELPFMSRLDQLTEKLIMSDGLK